MMSSSFSSLFFFNDPATTEIYTLSLHDALPISRLPPPRAAALHPLRRRGAAREARRATRPRGQGAHPLHLRRADHGAPRSEEHTSELQSQSNLVCRLLLEKKKKHCVASSPTYHD